MTVFLIIGAIGLVVVAMALLLGDVVEGLLHIDFLDGDLFSTASIAAFIGALGFGGAISLALFPVVWVAVLVGVVAGLLAAWGAASLTRWLRRSEGQSTFRADSLMGVAGRVITDIPGTGFGEVRINSQGHSRKLSARAAAPIPAGTEVWVSGIVSPTAVEVTLSRSEDSSTPL